MERGMLGVHRDDASAGGLGQRHHQLAAHHQAFLVGQRKVDSLAERGDRWSQSCRADQAIEHQVAVALGDQLHEPLRTGQHLAARPQLGGAGGGRLVRERHALHAEALGLLDERFHAGRGGKRDNLEVGAPLNDVECLRADRPRRAEDDHPSHASEDRRLFLSHGYGCAHEHGIRLQRAAERLYALRDRLEPVA